MQDDAEGPAHTGSGARRHDAAPALGAGRWAADVIDVFVYVVVLNLFVEYFPEVITETFTLSLLTALLLKVVLEAVVAVKTRLLRRTRQAPTALHKAAGVVLLWALLVASKFVVLEVVDAVLGDRVSLGGFVSVTALVVVLMLSRQAVRRLLALDTTG